MSALFPILSKPQSPDDKAGMVAKKLVIRMRIARKVMKPSGQKGAMADRVLTMREYTSLREYTSEKDHLIRTQGEGPQMFIVSDFWSGP